MVRQKIWVSASEIELLRRRLGEVAAALGGLPDNIPQKFERLVTIASDLSRQDEALRLETELFQFYYEHARQRRPISDRAVVSCRLEPSLRAALDRFIAEHQEVDSRRQAVAMLLEDALRDYIK